MRDKTSLNEGRKMLSIASASFDAFLWAAPARREALITGDFHLSSPYPETNMLFIWNNLIPEVSSGISYSRGIEPSEKVLICRPSLSPSFLLPSPLGGIKAGVNDSSGADRWRRYLGHPLDGLIPRD
jgi:hypothetical protein